MSQVHGQPHCLRMRLSRLAVMLIPYAMRDRRKARFMLTLFAVPCRSSYQARFSAGEFGLVPLSRAADTSSSK